MTKQILSAIKVSALALVLSFGLSYVYAWTAPTQNPPSGNVSAPLNTSSTGQMKDGGLLVGHAVGTPNGLIVENGNVGVGTTTPSTQLDVENSQNAATYIRSGNINAGSAAIAGLAMHSQGGSSYIFRTSNAATQGNATVIQDQIGPIIFNTASEAMRIDHAGNVGIGTITPAQKLDVNGTINASNINITTGGQYLNGVKGYLFGGFYTTASTFCSAINNPLTGGQSCPVGFSPLLSFGALCNASDVSDRFFYVCVK